MARKKGNGTEAKPRMYVSYAEAWYMTWCPYCDATNWHCNGNESDLSGLDVEDIKCCNCSETYRLGEYDSIAEEIRGADGMVVEVLGLKSPTEQEKK